MSTTATTPLEDARLATRRRRDLAQAVEDAKQDLLAAEHDLEGLSAQFRGPKSHVTPAQLEAARQRRDECVVAVGQASEALSQFELSSLSEERLKQLEKAEQVRAAEMAARAIVEADGHDLTEFLSFMDQAEVSFNRMAARRANGGGAGLLALEFLLPRSFWKFGPGEFAVGGASCWINRRAAAIAWLKSQKLPGPEPPAA